MKLPKFQYAAPKTVQEACFLLREQGERAMPIAGGTDLIPAMRNRLKTPEIIVDLMGIPDLDQVAYSEKNGLTLGALVTLNELGQNPIVKRKYPMLAQGVAEVGAWQLQSMGTIGGNLCLDTRCCYYNQTWFWHQAQEPCIKLGGEVCYVVKGSDQCWATYCADMAPILISLGARVKIADHAGQKVIPLGEFYSGDGHRPSILKHGELLTEIQLPPATPITGGAYLKLRRRKSIDFPQLGVAVHLQLAQTDGVCQEARVALTGVERAPLGIAEATALKGKQFSDEVLKEVIKAAYKQAHPLNNMIGLSPRYRKGMVKVLLSQAAHQAFYIASGKGGRA